MSVSHRLPGGLAVVTPAASVRDSRAYPTVRDVMTESVVVALADAGRPVDLTELTAALRGSAVPVVDADTRVVGIITATDLPLADLVAGTRGATRRPPSRWFRRQVRAARELMTTPVLTVPATAPVSRAARLMLDRGVKQLPVVDDAGGLVGLVTCRDLLAPAARPDAEIEKEITVEVLGRYLPSFAANVDVDVTDGVVTLSGTVPSATAVPLAATLIRGVPGVVGVVDRIAVAH